MKKVAESNKVKKVCYKITFINSQFYCVKFINNDFMIFDIFGSLTKQMRITTFCFESFF